MLTLGLQLKKSIIVINGFFFKKNFNLRFPHIFIETTQN